MTASTCETGVQSRLDEEQTNLVLRFFAHYASFFEGMFDHVLIPEETYEISPFLFWTIVCVGSRRYVKDPTIVERLGRAIFGLGLSSLFSVEDPMTTIQASLILCSWPPPITSIHKDPTQAIAGATMQLALQHRLHVFSEGQHFTKARPSPSEADKQLRLRMWTHCLVTFQGCCNPCVAYDQLLTYDSMSLGHGLPPMAIVTSFNPDMQHAIETGLPALLTHRYRVTTTVVEAVSILSSKGCLVGSSSGEELDHRIETFDAQLRSMAHQNHGDYCEWRKDQM